jgi:leucine dehydrogenase
MSVAEGAPAASADGRGSLPAGLDHEELVVKRGRRTGRYVVVAVHSTALGPALGGARLWRYHTPGDAIADALRLSEAMTYKAAAAGLDLGGGKAVLPVERGPSAAERRELMLDLGDTVESLGGDYITAEDVGTGATDMAIVAERTSHVVGLPAEDGGSGDPSPVTARGVVAAIRACCEHRFGSPELAGRRVCVVGLGHVGSRLAASLADAGAELLVSDIVGAKRTLASTLGAKWIEPESAAGVQCEVLAPCALGGAIDLDNIGTLQCAIVCGSANNILSDDSLAPDLAERGITYAPDFIVNSGGLINVYGEIHSLARDRMEELVDGIGSVLAAILTDAESRAITPLAAARELARERLERSHLRAAPATLGG